MPSPPRIYVNGHRGMVGSVLVLALEGNVIHQACRTGIKKRLFLGSNFIYPKLAHQPMVENVTSFSSSIVPEQWRLLHAVNPMAGVIEGFRWAITGKEA